MCVLNHFFGSATNGKPNGNIMNLLTNNDKYFHFSFWPYKFWKQENSTRISKCCSVWKLNSLIDGNGYNNGKKTNQMYYAHWKWHHLEFVSHCPIVYVNYSVILRKCVALENAISIICLIILHKIEEQKTYYYFMLPRSLSLSLSVCLGYFKLVTRPILRRWFGGLKLSNFIENNLIYGMKIIINSMWICWCRDR